MKTQSLAESEVNSQYMEQTKQKVESLRQSLLKFDKDLDDEINQEELLNFLDSNMKNGQKFDRNLAQKIFEALDLDKNRRISCEEFIKNYISIEEEIKAHAKELQNKYLQEKENNANLNKLLMENKNEKLNDEGIGQNAKLTIEISNIEFLRPIIGISENISIRIKFAGDEKETRVLSGEENFVVWKEKFEYRVTSKDILYFDVLNTDRKGAKEILGTVKFPLDKIERQEEYDLELEIPDENDERIITAKINAKIKFIWSIYKYYQDLLAKSERNLQNCNAMLQKTNKLIENLNEPLKFVEGLGDKFESENNNKSRNNDSFDRHNVIKAKAARGPIRSQQVVDESPQGISKNNNMQYIYADKIENFVKGTFSKN
jgi:hypothetical protein